MQSIPKDNAALTKHNSLDPHPGLRPRWEMRSHLLKPIFLHMALSASALLLSATGFAQPKSADGVPPLPENGIYPELPVFSWPDGELSWITSLATGKNPAQAVSSFWNPATGKTRQELLSIDGYVHSRTKTAHGIMLLVGTANAAQRLVLLATKTSIVSVPLLVARSNPQMVVLSDQSLVILGGRASNQRTAAVELVRLAAGRLVVEQLPDLPGDLRAGFSAVALADGRLMVLGGNSGRFIGCMPCTEETYFLDPLSKTWKSGPKLPEPRADATATLLPDGQVLLAGEWTPEFGWSEGPTRATALFNPVKNVFAPAQPLPTAVAMHQALWAPQVDGKNSHGQLLIAGGNSASVQSFDVTSGQWRLVGESCEGDEKGESLVLPFVFKNQSYLWRRANESGYCATKVQGWSLTDLRLPSSNRELGRTIHWKTGIALYRSQLAFAPSNGAGAALAVGGAIHAGMNAYFPTSAVDAIWPDGRIVALPSLIHARQGAQVVALPDGGFFVTGGTGGKQNQMSDILPAEWLAGSGVSSGAPWVTLDAQFSKDAVFGHLANGQVLALTAGTNLQSLVFADTGKGRPTVEFNALPALPHARRNAEDSRVLIKGLSDGRIIAAGGASRYHDIYDPSSGAWKRSAPSRGSGGPVAILNDGRVVRLSRIVAPGIRKKSSDGQPSKEIALLEVCSADGLSWRKLGKKPPLAIAKFQEARLFSIQDELFLSGRETAGDGPDLVQWFNSQSQRWEIVWEAATRDNWRLHVGRLIGRRLANGKQIILPVAGF